MSGRHEYGMLPQHSRQAQLPQSASAAQPSPCARRRRHPSHTDLMGGAGRRRCRWSSINAGFCVLTPSFSPSAADRQAARRSSQEGQPRGAAKGGCSERAGGSTWAAAAAPATEPAPVPQPGMRGGDHRSRTSGAAVAQLGLAQRRGYAGGRCPSGWLGCGRPQQRSAAQGGCGCTWSTSRVAHCCRGGPHSAAQVVLSALVLPHLRQSPNSACGSRPNTMCGASGCVEGLQAILENACAD